MHATLLQVRDQATSLQLASRHDDRHRSLCRHDLRVDIEGEMLGGDLGRLARAWQGPVDVYVAVQLHHTAPLRQLATRGTGGPLVALNVAKPETHLLELDHSTVRLLLDPGGIECVDRPSVGA